MARMQSMLERMGQKQKMMGVHKKQNQSQSDLGSTQELKLPQLSTTNYSENSEESKLMEQIRRVENKIRELKYQRNQFSSQQNNFQMIRPFLELQNQNMVNLQMMIIAQNRYNNQQQSSNQHQCCKNNGNSGVNILPMMPGMPGQYPPYQVPPPQQQMDSQKTIDDDESVIVQKHNLPNKIKADTLKSAPKKRNKNLPKKKYNMFVLAKFRSAVIAVYFALLFPKYANRFTLKRFKYHMAHIQVMQPLEKGKNSMVNRLVQELLRINLVEIVQKVDAQKKDNTSKLKGTAAQIMISEQHQGKNNFAFSVGDIQIFLLQFLYKLEQMLQQ